jgi:UDP-2,3-diacylglucosamine pyrophosphatase LpxH
MIRQAKKRNCDVVVCGHIHNPEDKKINGVRYLNTGDWVENCSYIEYEYHHKYFKLWKNL